MFPQYQSICKIFTKRRIKQDATVSNGNSSAEGARTVKRNVDLYNLDSIISVDTVRALARATHFRIWATGVLKEYMTKGFALDDERLKQGKTAFGKDYFRGTAERVRSIRASGTGDSAAYH